MEQEYGGEGSRTEELRRLMRSIEERYFEFIRRKRRERRKQCAALSFDFLIALLTAVFAGVFPVYLPAIQFGTMVLVFLRGLMRICTICCISRNSDVTKPIRPIPLIVFGVLVDIGILCYFFCFLFAYYEISYVIQRFSHNNIAIVGFSPIAIYAVYVSSKLTYYFFNSVYRLCNKCCGRSARDDVDMSNLHLLEEDQLEQIINERPAPSSRKAAAKSDVRDVVEQAKQKFRMSKLGGVMLECMICYEAFKDDDYISPLPCDHRHYFHTHCIKDWLQRENRCPLCSTPVPTEVAESYLARDVRATLRESRPFLSADPVL